MRLDHLTNEGLFNAIAKLGKEMTSQSSPRMMALEKERMIYVKELYKRGLGGMKSKKKYRNF